MRPHAELLLADLHNTSLRGADLTGANVGGADLTSANLGGADLTGAKLRVLEAYHRTSGPPARRGHKKLGVGTWRASAARYLISVKS